MLINNLHRKDNLFLRYYQQNLKLYLQLCPILNTATTPQVGIGTSQTTEEISLCPYPPKFNKITIFAINLLSDVCLSSYQFTYPGLAF